MVPNFLGYPVQGAWGIAQSSLQQHSFLVIQYRSVTDGRTDRQISLLWLYRRFYSLLCYRAGNKKAPLTQGLRATAPSFQDGGCSKMAVSRHLGFYRTANSAIRSADPEYPSLEPNVEWIGCTVCEIFAFKLQCDLETGVSGYSRSSKTAHTSTLYSSSTVTMPLLPFPRCSRILIKNRYPLVLAPPLGVTTSDLENDPW